MLERLSIAPFYKRANAYVQGSCLREPLFLIFNLGKFASIKVYCYTFPIQYKLNNQITAPELRVVDALGKNLGVMKLEEALKIAVESNLDLIEIAPVAKPPVAKIISFDKFRYQKEKEDKKQRHGQQIKELKHVRITPRAAKNDLSIKARQTDKFLEGGHRVEINLFLRGREKGNKEWGFMKLKEFLEMIKTPHEVTVSPKSGGRGLITQISKK